MNRSIVLALALAAAGCVKQPIAVYMDDQADGEAGHYVVVAAQANGVLRLFDCLARPDGSQWDPTCVRADFKTESGSTDR